MFCLPAPAKGASGYPLISSHYVQASTPNSVLYTVWIPDAVAPGTANVSEVSATGQSLGIVATLNDGGIAGDAVASDRVYSGYLTVSDSSPKTHYYQASYGVQRQIQRAKSPTVLITSLAIVPVASASAYYTGIDKSFSGLLDLFSQRSGLASPQPASNIAAFDRIQQDASFMQLQYSALDAYSPPNANTLQPKLRASAQAEKGFWSTIGDFFGLGGLTNKAASEQAIYADLKSANFNPADPAVANFMAWYNTPDPISGGIMGGEFCGPDINAMPNCRQDNADAMWTNYQGWQATKGISIGNVAQNTAKDALVAQAFGPVSDGAGDAITNIYQPGALGYVAVKAATEIGVGYLADQFVDSRGHSKVFIGQFGPGQSIQLPTGQHQILMSYMDAARDLVSDVPIVNTITPIVFNAGATEAYQLRNGWRMSGYNGQHTSQTMAAGPTTLPAFEQLIGTISGRFRGIGPDGSLITFDDGSGRLASYSSTGALKWATSIQFNYCYYGTDLVIGPEGTIYTIDCNVVSAWNAGTGAAVWPTGPVGIPNSGNERGSTAVDSAGNLYINTGASYYPGPPQTLTSISPNGHVRWQSSFPGRGYYSPVLSTDERLVYVSNFGDGVDALDESSGQRVYSGSYLSVGIFAPWKTIYGSFNSLVGCTGNFSSCTSIGSSGDSVSAVIAAQVNSLVLTGPNGFAKGVTSSGVSTWLGTEATQGEFTDSAGTLYYWNPSTKEVVATNGITGAPYWRQALSSSISTILLGDDGCLYLQGGTVIFKGCR